MVPCQHTQSSKMIIFGKVLGPMETDTKGANGNILGLQQFIVIIDYVDDINSLKWKLMCRRAVLLKFSIEHSNIKILDSRSSKTYPNILLRCDFGPSFNTDGFYLLIIIGCPMVNPFHWFFPLHCTGEGEFVDNVELDKEPVEVHQ